MKKKKILERYSRTPDNRLIINIAAGRVENLYNNFDRHTPYVKKELDQDLVDYMIDCASEIEDENFVIQIHLENSLGSELVSRVEASISNYFIYLRELEYRELARMTRTSLILFTIGVVILIISVWMNQVVKPLGDVVAHVFAEGFNVAAWVSLWNAIATFIINWSPHRRKIKVYDRISRAPVQFL